MSLLLTGSLARARTSTRQDAFHAEVTDGSLTFRDLIRAVAGYCGPLLPDVAALLGTRFHALRPDLFESAGHVGRLLRDGGLEGIAAARDAAAPHTFLTPIDDKNLGRHELLPGGSNAHVSTELPIAVSRRLRQAHCPSLEVISAT